MLGVSNCLTPSGNMEQHYFTDTNCLLPTCTGTNVNSGKYSQPNEVCVDRSALSPSPHASSFWRWNPVDTPSIRQCNTPCGDQIPDDKIVLLFHSITSGDEITIFDKNSNCQPFGGISIQLYSIKGGTAILGIPYSDPSCQNPIGFSLC